jgi:hypothetical protein
MPQRATPVLEVVLTLASISMGHAGNWRKSHGRIRPNGGDRFFFVQLYRWFPSTPKVI